MSGTELGEINLSELDDLAPSDQRTAVCAYGPSVYGSPQPSLPMDVLVVCEDYHNGLRTHRKILNGAEVRLLVAERQLVESDVKNGTLGDFLTETFLYPHRPIANQPYIEQLEVEAKGRIVKEEAKDLVLEYGEMSRGIVAAPEFFGLSRLRKRARVFLPSMDGYLRLLEPSVRGRNVSVLHESFKKAISTAQSDAVQLDGENVTIRDSAIDKWLAQRVAGKVVNVLQQSQRAFYSYLTKGRTTYLDIDLLARELYRPLRLGMGELLQGTEPEDPKNYLYLRTAEGLVSLNERASLWETVAKLRPGRPVTMAPLAGVLNEVYLVAVGSERLVAKRFTDWHGFKWFTLNLVSLGSKLFAVSGKARMTNEYGINRYLAAKGLKVPDVIHVGVKDRLLLRTYVSGTSLAEFAVQTTSRSSLTKEQYRIAERLGETLAAIHKVGVSVGDSKPENFVSVGDEIYVIDLEQAGRRGDYAWDVAELLFYTGHYSVTPAPSRGLAEVVHAFIRGYLRNGTAAELKRAAGLRYAKVFSLWTPAGIIMEISNQLRAAR